MQSDIPWPCLHTAVVVDSVSGKVTASAKLLTIRFVSDPTDLGQRLVCTSAEVAPGFSTSSHQSVACVLQPAADRDPVTVRESYSAWECLWVCFFTFSVNVPL